MRPSTSPIFGSSAVISAGLLALSPRRSRSTESSAAAVCSASNRVTFEKSRSARLSVRSRALRTSQIAEEMLMPTSTRPSAISARPRGSDRINEKPLLLAGRADQLGDRAEQLGALHRFGEGAGGPGLAGRLLGTTLPGAEMPGDGDELHSGILAPHPADRLGAAGTRHPHVGDHERGPTLELRRRGVTIHRLAHDVARAFEPVDDQIAHDRVVVDDQDLSEFLPFVLQAPIPPGGNCV